MSENVSKVEITPEQKVMIDKYKQEAMEAFKSLPTKDDNEKLVKERVLEEFNLLTDEDLLKDLEANKEKIAKLELQERVFQSAKAIVLFQEQHWNRQARKITDDEFGEEPLIELAKNLEATMRLHKGIGVASTQIGDERDMFCIWNVDMNHVLFCANAQILEASKEMWEADEGCLTFLKMRFERIKRHRQLKVKYYNVDGVPVTKTLGLLCPELTDQEFTEKYNRTIETSALVAKGKLDEKVLEDKTLFFTKEETWEIWSARVFQHEFEHNNGGSVINHMGIVRKGLKKDKFFKTLKKHSRAVKNLKKR